MVDCVVESSEKSSEDGVERQVAQSGSENLLRDAQGQRFGNRELDAAVAEIQRQESYKGAVKTEADAEINWNQSIGNAKSLSAADIKSRLNDNNLSPQAKGFLQFLDDNFSNLAGAVSKDASHVSKADLMAIGGMNSVSPERIDAGAKFLKDHFFELSGLDDKVSAQRIDRLIYDHSFQLFSKETQDRLYDVANVVKSSDQSPQSFEQGKRVRSGLTRDDANTLQAQELSDNLRIQALQKALYGAKLQRFDGKTLGGDSSSQYNAAAQRYRELQKKGLDSFLAAQDR